MSPNNKIQGLVIDSFQQDGIRIQGTPTGTSNNIIYCNFVGIDRIGTSVFRNGWNQAGYYAGVNIVVTPGAANFAFNNRVYKNISSGNYAEGVGISSCPPGDCYSNTVDSNYIGTDITGTLDCGNVHDGVYIGEGAHHNIVDANLISGNDFEGVCIVGYVEAVPPVTTHHNTVSNNIIGLTINLNPLGNMRNGVSIGKYGGFVYMGGFVTDNILVVNKIAHNTGHEIMVWEHWTNTTNADRNQITQNSIYNNSWLGIDLGDNGVTTNDIGDLDNGANQELNFPVITSAQFGIGGTTISGTLDIGQNPTTAVIELYKAQPDISGYGEGMNYLGFVNPSSSGSWNITLPGLVVGDTVTATAIDSAGNTSEFAQNARVVLGIEENNVQNKKYAMFSIYPNSAKTFFSVGILSKSNLCFLKIYNFVGNLIRQEKIDHLQPRVSLDDIEQGIYFLQINNKPIFYKLIITK